MRVARKPLSQKSAFEFAANFNILVNRFLPGVRTMLKEDAPESIILPLEITLVYFDAIRENMEVERPMAQTHLEPEYDFSGTVEATTFITNAWLFAVALELKEFGRVGMITDGILVFFPGIFEPTIVYGKDVINMLREIEKGLPHGDKIPAEAGTMLKMILS